MAMLPLLPPLLSAPLPPLRWAAAEVLAEVADAEELCNVDEEMALGLASALLTGLRQSVDDDTSATRQKVMRAEAKALARLLCASAPRTALRRRLGLVVGGGLLELAARYPYPPASAVSSSLGIVSELLVCALMPDPRSAGSDDEAASLARDLVGNIIFAASRRPAAAAALCTLCESDVAILRFAARDRALEIAEVAAADGHEEAVEEKRALRHTAARLLIHELYVPDWFARALEWRTYEPARLSELAAAAASFRIRSLSLLSALLRCVDALHSPTEAATAVVACLAFAPENDIESCIWTDAHLRSRASQVATAISARFRPSDAGASEDAVDAFLRTSLDDVVAHLRPLMRAGEKGTQWKSNAHGRFLVHLIVKRIRFPNWADRVGLILPLVLPLVGDFELHNKALGLGALEHLLRHAHIAELRWHGALLLHNLKLCLSFRELPVALSLMPCLDLAFERLFVRDAVKDAPFFELLTELLRELRYRALSAAERGDDAAVVTLHLRVLPTACRMLGSQTAVVLRDMLGAVLLFVARDDECNVQTAAIDVLVAAATSCPELVQRHCGKLVEALLAAALALELRRQNCDGEEGRVRFGAAHAALQRRLSEAATSLCATLPGFEGLLRQVGAALAAAGSPIPLD